jgi:hypothetical protein
METMITTDIFILFTSANGICEEFRVHAMVEVEVEVHLFLTSVPGRGEWLASRPGRFTPREITPATH